MAGVRTFYRSLVGKKIIMAVTGLLLLLFVLFHLTANLEIFLGREALNRWAATLDSLGLLLWAARATLLVTFCVHVVAAIQVWWASYRARPIPYQVKKDIATSYAARTMIISGPLILFFLIYHVMMFTFLVTGPGYSRTDVYSNVVAAFQVPSISGVYILTMLILGYHLYHATWSMLHTFGISNPRYQRLRWILSPALAAIVTLGFILIPVAVLTGFIQ